MSDEYKLSDELNEAEDYLAAAASGEASASGEEFAEAEPIADIAGVTQALVSSPETVSAAEPLLADDTAITDSVQATAETALPAFVQAAKKAKAEQAALEAESAAKAAEEEGDDFLPEYDETEEDLPAPPAAGEGPVIVFDHVTKEYEDGPEEADAALKDVSFSIERGEFVFIVGPSGSGKSTLIRLLMREISPTSGNIFIAGSNLSRLRNRQVCKYRRSIGIVFQDFRLLEDRTVFENIAFAQKVIGVPSRRITKNVSKMLSMVRLRNKYRSYPNKLSGGEQQRVALARALVNNPLILLADEPTGNLDPANTEDIMELLEDINLRGTTVVVVTHNREIMQKRVIALRDGEIVDDKKGGYDRG